MQNRGLMCRPTFMCKAGVGINVGKEGEKHDTTFCFQSQCNQHTGPIRGLRRPLSQCQPLRLEVLGAAHYHRGASRGHRAGRFPCSIAGAASQRQTGLQSRRAGTLRDEPAQVAKRQAYCPLVADPVTSRNAPSGKSASGQDRAGEHAVRT